MSGPVAADGFSAAWRDFVAAAAPGRFPTPCCTACAHRFFPPQGWCPRCLDSRIDYVCDAGAATVISTTLLHRSFAARWRDRLPVCVARVRTASGIALFALADAPWAAGTAVVLGMCPPGSEDAGLVRAQAIATDVALFTPAVSHA